jgi:K(+)-stimulated pyrophosphate-energized sodium pump
MIAKIKQTLKKWQGRDRVTTLSLLATLFGVAFFWHPTIGHAAGEAVAVSPVAQAAPAAAAPVAEKAFEFFEFLGYNPIEKFGLLVVLGIAFIGLAYAFMLIKQVGKTDRGTKKMQDIAAAVREGALAYLKAQTGKIVWFVIAIFIILLVTYQGSEPAFKYGRACAFLIGAIFSWATGFVGMYFATDGNLRVAAAARHSYGDALQVGYRTGTITGMLLDSLGLLGGTTIFLLYGVKSYEALLGFGFGGTLLALFMRVGGGIYTKAADVGADLVGKIEKNIPEDDPRNAATIADNVGDNVGDCAGMAADVFESYEVTIVAAMILGLASFGHIGVIFPLLVRGVGVLGSIISTYTVKADANSTSDSALHSVHNGFWIGSMISVIGILALSFTYMKFSAEYLAQNLGAAAGFPNFAQHAGAVQGYWFNFGFDGIDWRPAITCIIGIILAITLNKLTSYYTHTTHAPVRELAKSCQTGHATNIISGLAIGYESSVAAIIVIVIALVLSVLTYWGTPPVFVAYGVAMAGIGMLTLTGNTISMDTFGPIADNANGIGEMGYDKKEMGEANYKRARQILADLDAVGNTTKAETKGIAIGSAVIAAVSLFSSFIAVIAVGSEDKIMSMTEIQYNHIAGLINVANPLVLVGFLIGGAVPFLFSSMLLRAVGRAAFNIVNECRMQFQDKEIWAGNKKPDYGRVVSLCTIAAQTELVGPAILAVAAPLVVGFLLGPYALGGFLAGMILTGQLLAVFMANAGGAWDNAKKFIEDGNYGGKGSESHKAAVTGDTVGDPLKDTAGPALNPLLKVMNMVALLGLGVVLKYNVAGINPLCDRISGEITNNPTTPIVGAVIAVLLIIAIAWSVNRSHAENPSIDAK